MILKTCQAQWNLGEYNNSWRIADEDNNVLLVLPPQINDAQDVGAIRKFAMEHEQLAFDEGVEMGKQSMLAANREYLKQLNDKILLLQDMNKELNAKLQRFFLEDDEEDFEVSPEAQ